MNSWRRQSHRRPATGYLRLLAAILLFTAVSGVLLAADKAADPIVTAVFSNVFNGYQRTRLPDGSFKPETYTFGDGGRRNTSGRDASVDDLPFARIAHIIAGPLAERGYRPS